MFWQMKSSRDLLDNAQDIWFNKFVFKFKISILKYVNLSVFQGYICVVSECHSSTLTWFLWQMERGSTIQTEVQRSVGGTPMWPWPVYWILCQQQFPELEEIAKFRRLMGPRVFEVVHKWCPHLTPLVCLRTLFMSPIY